MQLHWSGSLQAYFSISLGVLTGTEGFRSHARLESPLDCLLALLLSKICREPIVVYTLLDGLYALCLNVMKTTRYRCIGTGHGQVCPLIATGAQREAGSISCTIFISVLWRSVKPAGRHCSHCHFCAYRQRQTLTIDDPSVYPSMAE